MSDLPPSEFGGKTNKLGIQPFPHRPTAAERLSVIYRTGDETGGESGVYEPIDEEHAAFEGLLTEAEQLAILESEGKLEKGQVWEEMESG
jgi:hypothetical protein